MAKKLLKNAAALIIIVTVIMAAHLTFIGLDNVNSKARLAVPEFMYQMCLLEGGVWHADVICEWK